MKQLESDTVITREASGLYSKFKNIYYSLRVSEANEVTISSHIKVALVTFKQL